MSRIDNHILKKIFVKLPVKSLIYLKSVCKNWCDIIEDPKFHDIYIKAQQQFPRLVLRSPTLYISDVNMINPPTKLNHPLRHLRDSAVNVNIQVGFTKCTKIVGVCRGLICFSMEKYPYSVILYNPTTMSIRILPAMPDFSLSKEEREDSYMGFGYDADTQDYKYVQVLQCNVGSQDDTRMFLGAVFIYSLRNNRWSSGGDGAPEFLKFHNKNGVDMNGILHWVIKPETDLASQQILTYSLFNSNFGSLAAPCIDTDTSFIQSSDMVVLDECLCLTRNYVLNNRHYYFDFWVMQEDSWTRICKFKKDNPAKYLNLTAICYFKKENKLLVHYNLFEIGYMDINNLKIKDVRVLGNTNILDVHICPDNLLMFNDTQSSQRDITLKWLQNYGEEYAQGH
ncbi:unnamed protein product [Amaranthus hypochondriacus]